MSGPAGNFYWQMPYLFPAHSPIMYFQIPSIKTIVQEEDIVSVYIHVCQFVCMYQFEIRTSNNMNTQLLPGRIWVGYSCVCARVRRVRCAHACYTIVYPVLVKIYYLLIQIVKSTVHIVSNDYSYSNTTFGAFHTISIRKVFDFTKILQFKIR